MDPITDKKKYVYFIRTSSGEVFPSGVFVSIGKLRQSVNTKISHLEYKQVIDATEAVHLKEKASKFLVDAAQTHLDQLNEVRERTFDWLAAWCEQQPEELGVVLGREPFAPPVDVKAALDEVDIDELTPEERKAYKIARRRMHSEDDRLRKTPEQKKAQSAKVAAALKARLAAMSPEELAAYRADRKAKHLARKARMTPEQIALEKVKQANRSMTGKAKRLLKVNN